MTAQENKFWNTENKIKAVYGALALFLQGVLIFYSLKTEVHDNKTMDAADKQVINFRLATLEQVVGILPKEPKIESK